MGRVGKIGILIIALLVIVVAARYVDIPYERFPTPGNIDEAETEVADLQKDLAVLKKKQQKYQNQRKRLESQASDFWPSAEDKNPKVLVQDEFEELAQNAQVRLDSMGGVQVNETSELVREVSFSVQLNTSMQEFSRLLARIDQGSHNYYWDRCTIRPANRNNPRDVRISGKVKTFVLTPEATRFIFEEEQQEDTAS